MDLDDILRIAIPALLILGPLLARAFSSANQAGPRPAPQPQDDVEINDALQDEIDEFLRRASPKRVAQADQRAPLEAAVEAEVVDVEVAEARRPIPSLYDDVDTHVDQHLDSKEFEQRSSRLGRKTGRSDERLEEHLHEVFDHKLGKLEGSPSGAPGKAPIREGTDAKEWASTVERREQASEETALRHDRLRDMIRNPENLREAIILSEILGRRDRSI